MDIEMKKQHLRRLIALTEKYIREAKTEKRRKVETEILARLRAELEKLEG